MFKDLPWENIKSIRFAPFDVSTADGRASERLRKAGLTTLTSAIARIVAMITPLVSIPLTIKYLGQERYGMWQTLASVTGLLAFADFGMGNGLLTAIAHASGRNDKDIAAKYVSSAFFMLSAVAFVFAVCFLGISHLIAWSRIFNVKNPVAVAEAGPAMTAFMLCFILNIPLGIVQKVQSGYQEGFQSNLWQCFGTITALFFVIVAVHSQLSLPVLVFGLSGVPIIFTVMNAGYFFGHQRTWLRPRRRYFHWETARNLLRTGSFFFVISIFTSIGIGADNIIVAQVLGPDSVTALSVPARMAMPLVAFAQMMIVPMWSANAEAIACGDVAWVRQTVAKMTKATLLLTVSGALALILFGPWAIAFLSRNTLETSFWLLSGLGAWAVLIAAAGPGFMVLNAAGVLKPQIVIHSIFAVLSISAKIWLASRLGISGIVWSGVLIYLIVVILPLRALVARTLDSLANAGPVGTLK